MFFKIKNFFLSCLLLPFIINVNNRQQTNLNKFKLKPISTILTNNLLPKKPLTIEEQYYQLTINNQVDEAYQFFDQMLERAIKEANNNSALLKKYQRLKLNWKCQYNFNIENKKGIWYYLFLIIFISLIFIIIKKIYDCKKNNDINKYFDFSNSFKKFFISYWNFLTINDNEGKFFKFYTIKYLYYEYKDFFIESAINNWQNNDGKEIKQLIFNHEYQKLLNTFLDEIRQYDFWKKFQMIMNIDIEKKNLQSGKFKIFLFNDYKLQNKKNLFDEIINEQNFQKIINSIVDLGFSDNKKTIKEKILNLLKNFYDFIYFFITKTTVIETMLKNDKKISVSCKMKSDQSYFFQKINEKIIIENDNNVEYHLFKTQFNFNKEVLEDNFNFFVENVFEGNPDYKLLFFIKKQFLIAFYTVYLNNNIINDGQLTVDKLEKILKINLLLVLRLIFINFIIANFLFNGYWCQKITSDINSVINSVTKGDEVEDLVITINGFAYVRPSPRFNIYLFNDDGFVIKHKKFKYYRSSVLITDKTCNQWQNFQQVFDLLICIFLLLIYLFFASKDYFFNIIYDLCFYAKVMAIIRVFISIILISFF